MGSSTFSFRCSHRGFRWKNSRRPGCRYRRYSRISSDSFWYWPGSDFLAAPPSAWLPPFQESCLGCWQHSSTAPSWYLKSTQSSPSKESTTSSIRCYSRRPHSWQVSARTDRRSEKEGRERIGAVEYRSNRVSKQTSLCDQLKNIVIQEKRCPNRLISFVVWLLTQRSQREIKL